MNQRSTLSLKLRPTLELRRSLAAFGLLSCAVAASAVSAPSIHAAPATLPLTQNFDDQVPGDTPAGWKVIWGQQGDDQLTVSNVQSASPGNSVLIDRQSGTSLSQYGVGRAFPNAVDGWVTVAFSVLAEGDAPSCGVEIRDFAARTDSKVASLGIGGGKATFTTGDYKTRVNAAELLPGQWHRYILVLPGQNAKGTQATLTVQTRDAAGKWVNRAQPVTVTAKAPGEKYGTLLINLPPNKRNFKFYVDDFEVTHSTEEPKA